MSKSTLAGSAAALVGVQVGSSMVATRFVIEHIRPFSLAFLRYGIAAACLLLPLLASKRVPFLKKDLIPIILLGITQFGITAALLNSGLKLIPSARASLILATLPLLSMVLARTLGYETFTLTKSLGVLITIGGVGFVLGERALIMGGAGGLRGEISVLICTVLLAVCSVLYRPYLKKYPTIQVSFLSMISAVIFLGLFAIREGFFNYRPSFSGEAWSAVAFIGLASGAGYFLWLWALRNTTTTKATIFLSLNPIAATALGALFLGEKVTVRLLIGIACVLAGIGVAHIQSIETLRG